jgi:hypothetical protein
LLPSRAKPVLVLLLTLGLLVSTVGVAAALPRADDFGSAIDRYASYDVTSEECANVEQPGVVEFRSLLRQKYGANAGGILRTCNRNTRSAHQTGRAYDWMLDANKAADRAKADEVLNWLLATDRHGNKHAMARRLGIIYIIWNERWWSSWNADAGWQPYNGWSPHTDHIHFSFGWPGARQQTSYWTAQPADAPAAPPPAAPLENTCTGVPHALSGDWDGSGRDGVGYWCDGKVRLRTSRGQIIEFSYGRRGDYPVAGDWNNNGRDSIGIVRDDTWHLRNSLSGGGGDLSFRYGRVSQGDVPVVGNWSGSGAAAGIIRDGQWHLRNSLSGGAGEIVFTYGRITRGDRPLIGDWNGDGRDRIGIVRDGQWHLRHSLSGGHADVLYTYGRVRSGDAPVMGDWTGDRRTTPGIARVEEWHLRNQHAGGPADQVLIVPPA